MRLHFELNANDYGQMCSRFGMKLDGVLATVSLLIGVNLLITANAPSWLGSAFWIVVIVTFWIIIFRRLRGLGRKPSPLLVWGTRISATLLWGLLAAVTLRHRHEPDSSAVFLILPIACLVADFFTPAISRLLNRSQWRTLEHLHGPRTVELRESEIVVTQAESTSSYSLSAIKSVEQTPDLILLRLATSAFLLIPKRAFATDQDRERFIAAIQSHLLPTASLA